MSWYVEALKKYVAFSGRARRKEYWYFVLFSTITVIVLVIVDAVIGTLDSKEGIGLLSGLYSLAILLPSAGVSVRRLHDIGRSGWWLFISLIPIIGGIVFLVFLVKDGEPGENKYGSNPKEATA